MDIIVNNIPTELAQRITRAADAGGLSVNAYIRRAVEEKLGVDAPAKWIDRGSDAECSRCGACIDGEAYFLLENYGRHISYCPYCGAKTGREEDNNGTD